MNTLKLEVSRKVPTIFGAEIVRKASVTVPQVSDMSEILEQAGNEEAAVAVYNFALRILAQRSANNDLKTQTSGLSEADSDSVKLILRHINQAVELGDDPKEVADRILSKAKFAHLRPVFEGQNSGAIEVDYTGFDSDGSAKLRAPKERSGDE